MSSEEFQLQHMGGEPGQIATFRLQGDIDMANAAVFEEAVSKRLEAGALVLDLSAAKYFDSAGFAALDRLLSRGQLQLVIGPACLLRKAAVIVGMPFHDDVESARGAIARPED
jgi:anti-sigma B factor antagonist